MHHTGMMNITADEQRVMTEAQVSLDVAQRYLVAANGVADQAILTITALQSNPLTAGQLQQQQPLPPQQHFDPQLAMSLRAVQAQQQQPHQQQQPQQNLGQTLRSGMMPGVAQPYQSPQPAYPQQAYPQPLGAPENVPLLPLPPGVTATMMADFSGACFAGSLQKVQQHIASTPAIVNGHDAQKRTPLYSACRDPVKSNPQVVEFLLQHTADPTVASTDIGSFCAHAAVKGISDVLEVVRASRPPDAEAQMIATVDHVAAILQTLRNNGVSVETMNNDKKTPMHELMEYASEAKELNVFTAATVEKIRNLSSMRLPTIYIAMVERVRSHPRDVTRAHRPLTDPCTIGALASNIYGSGQLQIRIGTMQAALTFEPARLEYAHGDYKYSIQIAVMPQFFNLTKVAWEILYSNSLAWSPAPDDVCQQLNAASANSTTLSFQLGQDVYTVDHKFIIAGPGDLSGALLRWLPTGDVGGMEDGVDDDVVTQDEASIPQQGTPPAISVPIEIAGMNTSDAEGDAPPPYPGSAIPYNVVMAAQQPPPVPQEPPKTALRITLNTRHFTQEHAQIIANLPHVLKVEKTLDFRWDDLDHCIVCNVTTQQDGILRAILHAIGEADKRVIEAQEYLRVKIVERHTHVSGEVRTNDVKLARGDMLLAKCKEYGETLREHVKQLLEHDLNALKIHVGNNSRNWISACLNNPQQGMAQVGASVLQYCDQLLKAQQYSSLKRAALSRYFEKRIGAYSQDEMKPGHRTQLMEFIKDIMAQAAGRFVLPTLLRNFEVHLQAALGGLPFYTETARDLQSKIRGEKVVVVNTGTGSGKSTLMPTLLLACGQSFNRIAVTQPRRFAAESICDRLEKAFGPQIVGFRMAGKSHNPTANIVYYTDGLLRTLINPFSSGGIPFDLIIIDEVHERSKEIDACIALLALAMKMNVPCPKVILASATFDEAVVGPFRRANVKCVNIGIQPKRLYIATEHFSDMQCAKHGCDICGLLRASPYYLDMVLLLQRKLRGAEQLLLFLPSKREVTDAIAVLERHHVAARPLYAAQSGAQQLQYLREARVFVSTNIAETSLTFPFLRYVVDLGKAQRPKSTAYGMQMETVDAPESTLRQRRGRVGRTMNGDYVALYKKATKRREHIEPKVDLEGFDDLLFSLQLQLGQNVELDFPGAAANKRTLPRLDAAYFKYPVLGGRQMTDAFHHAVASKCNLNVLALAALRKTASAVIVQQIVADAAGSLQVTGDVSTASAIMVALSRTHFDQKHLPYEIQQWCNRHNLGAYGRNLLRAYTDMARMKEHCERNGVHLAACNMAAPEPLLVALAKGFPDRIFLSCVMFYGQLGYYSRALDLGDGMDKPTDTTQMITLSSFHSKSRLMRWKDPNAPATGGKRSQPPCVLSLDFMLFGAEMPNDTVQPYRLGVLSMNDVLDVTKLQDIRVERRIRLRNAKETAAAGQNCVADGGRNYAYFRGPLPTAVTSMCAFLKSTVVKETIPVEMPVDNGSNSAKFERENVERLLKALNDPKHKSMFLPLKYFWSNSCQMEIKVMLGAKPPGFEVEGRSADVERFKDHMHFWSHQLRFAPVVSNPDAFGHHKSFVRPDLDDAGRKRLHLITAPEMREDELWKLCDGPSATRETRMCVVARIAIHVFQCRLTGGFLRDYVVNNDIKHPSTKPEQWVVQPTGGYVKYDLVEDLLPRDLDIELPPNTKYFDVARFISECRTAGIEVDFHEHIPQRHVFVFDKSRGPFMADFIEHHFSALHTIADFDCNLLCAMAPFQDLLGAKLPIRGYEVSDVIPSIRAKQLTVLRAENPTMTARIAKMQARGWTKVKDAHQTALMAFQNYEASIVRMPKTDAKFEEYRAKIAAVGGSNIQIFQIAQHASSELWNNMKGIIGNENGGDPNIRELFHGTATEDGVTGILHHGLDDRYWSAGGFFGRGAYHADDPKLSLSFTSKTNPRTIFVCKVILGKQQDLSATPLTTQKGAAFFVEQGKHSVKGRVLFSTGLREMEYIVYRFGQSLPLYMIRFDV